jgi:peptide/nickel transport system permease protein
LRDALDPRSATTQPMLRIIDRLMPGIVVPSRDSAPLFEIRDLTLSVDTPTGAVRPVEDISLSVGSGETLAIVGESGSGKSLTALAAMGLLPAAVRPTAGSVWLDGEDLLHFDEPAMRKLRGGRIAMIFQDPMSSLNPVHRAGDQVAEAISAHQSLSHGEARKEALALFRRVGIADPEQRLAAYPHEMSGGMKQRVMIAMAIANRPALLIADEPTTALDVTVQAQILDLLLALKRESSMAMIFITHSLSVVAEIADRVTVMYAGQVVEEGVVTEVFREPLHPYTRSLLAASPEGDEPLVGIPGVVPQPSDFPVGCRFAARCAYAASACTAAPVPLTQARPGRRTRCIRWTELPHSSEVAA